MGVPKDEGGCEHGNLYTECEECREKERKEQVEEMERTEGWGVDDGPPRC